MKVLVVDDESTIVELVQHHLIRAGYSVITALSAEEALRRFRASKPDIIVLDVMLPGRSGFELCKLFREESQVPIIFLTAKSEETDRVLGFELGADDYVVKPFSPKELVARVKSVLRRVNAEPQVDPIKVGNLLIDPVKYEVTKNNKSVELSPKEFALLHFFVTNIGRVFNRDILLDRVWGADAYVGARTVDVHIRWLRAKLEDDPDNPKNILTVRGVGYKFNA